MENSFVKCADDVQPCVSVVTKKTWRLVKIENEAPEKASQPVAHLLTSQKNKERRAARHRRSAWLFHASLSLSLLLIFIQFAMSERGGAVRRRGRGFGARGGFKRQHASEQEYQQDGEGASGAADEAPEIKALREKYGSSVSTVQAVFPEWDDESTLFALGEANGSVELAISRIAEGERAWNVSTCPCS